MLGRARSLLADLPALLSYLRRAWPLMTITLFQTAAFTVVFFAISQKYFVDELGLGIKFPGYVLTSIGLAKLIFQAPAGWLSDRLGRRAALRIGLGGKLAVILVLPLVREPGILLGLAALFGVATAITSPAIYAIVGDVFDSDKRGKTVALLDLAYAGGLGIGALTGILLVGFAPYAIAFTFAITFSAIAFATAVTAVSARRGSLATASPPLRRGLPDIRHILSSGALMLGAIAVLTSIATNMMAPLFRPYGREVLGLEMHQLALYLAAPAALALLILVPAGHLADRMGRLLPLTIGMAVAAVALLAVSQTSSPWLAMALIAPGILGYVLALPAWNAAVLDLTRSDNRGTLWGALAMLQGIGGSVGPAFGGYWAEQFSTLSAIRLASALIAIAAVISLIYLTSQRRPMPRVGALRTGRRRVG